MRQRLRHLQERFADPLLTTLTIMVAILLFDIAPLQVAGAISEHYFGYIFLAVLIVAAFTLSRSSVALCAILIAIALIAIDVTLKLQHPSFIEIYLDAVAWLIAGLTLSMVVARAVFAPGKVTFHRIVGAILLYLSIGWVFVGAFSFAALLVPDAFKGFVPSEESFINIAGNLIHFSFITLTTTGYGDISPVHPLCA